MGDDVTGWEGWAFSAHERMTRVSATDNLGKHLLGRMRRPKDKRDWTLDVFIARSLTDTPLDVLLRKAVTHRTKPLADWMTMVTSMLDQLAPGTPTPPPPPSAVVWEDKTQLDQGQTPHCVGDGWAGWRACAPVEDEGVTQATADAIYYACKVIDGQPKQEDGTDVRSGAKVMQNAGLLKNYAFAETIEDVTLWLSTQGPIVFGTDWTDDMFTPEPGTGRVVPSGAVAGGHCYLGVGYDSATELILCKNSWGANWGVGGDFVISRNDMQALLASQGDACTGVELAA